MDKRKSMLLNPNKIDSTNYDKRTASILQDTAVFFEAKGLKDIRLDDKTYTWQYDWMKYQAERGIFSTLLTLKDYGKDDDARFDLFRLTDMSEMLGFYGEAYQYPLQVSVLGVGPIWMSDNEVAKQNLADNLAKGGVAAFGMSEKAYGADLYANKATITPQKDGTYLANGNKYYIGNAETASDISVMGSNVETGEYAFWVVDSAHRNYSYIKDIEVPGLGQARVGEFEMIEYPLTKDDILYEGDIAFANGLAAVNIGKFQLGFASVGIATHAFYEAITHANNRVLYGKPVTELPHIQSFFSEAFVRINMMKLYAMRARDYFRLMSDEDRRYLLYVPINKMKVSTEGGVVLDLIMDIVCAKGYENENFIANAHATIDMLFRLEGTEHVNMGLVVRFMKNYFFDNVDYPEVGYVKEAKDDVNIFKQTLGGLSGVKFRDYAAAYEGVDIPNVNKFKEIVEEFKTLIKEDAPSGEKLKNMDYMINYGQLFTTIVYGQLILEGSKIHNVADELIDKMFSILIRDVNKYALEQLNTRINSDTQNRYLEKIALMGPLVDEEKDEKFFREFVQVLDGEYIMNDAPIGNEDATRNLLPIERLGK